MCLCAIIFGQYIDIISCDWLVVWSQGQNIQKFSISIIVRCYDLPVILPGGLEAAPGGMEGRTLQVQFDRLEGEGPWDPDPVDEVGGPPDGTTLPGVVEIGGTLLLGEGPFAALD